MELLAAQSSLMVARELPWVVIISSLEIMLANRRSFSSSISLSINSGAIY